MTSPAKPRRLAFWWALLFASSGISLFLNVWHAVNQSEGRTGHAILAVTYAVVPVVFAGWLSHGLVNPLLGIWPRRVIITLFLAALAMSMSAQAEVMEPYGGDIGRWGIPLILDVSALVALHIITQASDATAKAARAAAWEADMERMRADIRATVEADIYRQVEADMERVRAAITADANARAEADMSARLSAVEADTETRLEDMRSDIRTQAEADAAARLADMEADIRRQAEADMAARWVDSEADIRARAEADMAARLPDIEADIRRRIEADIRREVRREMSGKTKTQPRDMSAPKREMTSAEREKLARELLREDPGMSGADLGRAVGVSARQGVRLRDKILPGVAGHAADIETDVSATEPDTDADTSDRQVHLHAVR
ncbi:hypothetical protein [Streptosporangium sp. NPDC051022]|uniref:hypothetical protein n=1 Tax=Streptosporangium sp. NPDC051022 TaxID=3155752 RepID=UPI00342485EC